MSHPQPQLKADAKGAGATALLLQSSLPILMLRGGNVVLRGGTNAPMAPQADYVVHVSTPGLARFLPPGDAVATRLVCRGVMPRGGGEISVECSRGDAELPFVPVDLVERGEVAEVGGVAWAVGSIPAKVAQRIAAGAAKAFSAAGVGSAKLECEIDVGNGAGGNGCGVVLWARTTTGMLLGADALGERGVSAEKVGAKAARALTAELAHGGVVDSHMQDQLLVFMALASGRSRVNIGTAPPTEHTRAAMAIVESLSPARFTLTTTEAGLRILECNPVGGGDAPMA